MQKSKTTMYSFEGQFRRTPEQNLAGASVKPRREELLQMAHADRLKREYERKKILCAMCIQAYARGFICRQRLKNENRKIFDQYAHMEPASFTKITSLGSEDDALTILLTKFLSFYNPKCDTDKLTYLSQCLLTAKEEVATRICKNIRSWRWKMKKFLGHNLNFILRMCTTQSMSLRMLEEFMSEQLFTSVADVETVHAILLELYMYVLKRGYYSCMRLLVDQRIPPLMLSSSIPPTPFASSLIQFIQRPLILIYKTEHSELCRMVLDNLMRSFLHREYNEKIKCFIIPFLEECSYLPYEQLLEVVHDLQTFDKLPQSSWLLVSLLSLQPRDFLLKCGDISFRNYVEIIAYHALCLCRLIEDEDITIEDSDSDNSDYENLKKEKSQPLSQLEHEVLSESICKLNEYSRVQQLVNRLNKLQNTDDLDLKLSVVHSMANICYYLTVSKPSDNYELGLLSSICLQPQFLQSMWYLIKKLPTSTFGMPYSYITAISNAIELPIWAVPNIVPLISTFCSLFALLTNTFDDIEFHGDTEGTGRSPFMPFTMQEMVELCHVLKELCFGLIELAFPDTKLGGRRMEEYSVSENDQLVPNDMWMRLFQSAMGLVRKLYTRDLRIRFCPDGFWISHRIILFKLDRTPDIKFMSVLTRRRNIQPFSGPHSYTREELEEDGPPLSCRELRLLMMIRYMPFLLPFRDRVTVFQGHILKDKLEYQGEIPYAFRGKSIDVTIRRNYLYEDAFDKLSSMNEPDLRYVMRVQLRSTAGLDEPGIDGGGLFREFMSELLKTAFDPNRGFFKQTTDNQLYPNPFVNVLHDNYYAHYYFIGRMLGKAMYENLLIELPLAEFFLSTIAVGSDIALHHVASLDPVLHKNLLFLKNYDGDASELGLDFTIVIDDLGSTKVVELKPGGANIPVTNENKIEYIHLVADYKLNKQILMPSLAFKKGLSDVIKPHWLHMFSYKELQILISGAEMPIDINDLRTYTKYSGGFHEDHATIKLFWQVMENFDDNERKLMLKFVTSCSRQPLFGFKELDPPFCIQRCGTLDRLPTASTCMNLLKIPELTDYDTLHSRLVYAIKAEAGFELS